MLKKILIALPVLVIALTGGAWWFINDRARSMVDELLDAMVASGGYESLDYEELQIHLNGDVTMKNLNIVQPPIGYTLQNITVSNFDYTSEFPRTVDVTINGLRLPPLDPATADPQLTAVMSLLGPMTQGATIPLAIKYSLRYDPDNAHQTDSTVRVTVPDSFTFDFNGITRNLPMSTWQTMNTLDPDPVQAQAQLLALLADMEIPSMDFSLQDQGFLDLLLTQAAEQNGAPPEDFRNLLVSQARNFYLFLPQETQGIGMTTGIELAAFLEGGKTLSVSITPEYGGNFQRLQEELMGAVFSGNYVQAVELLHLEITAR